MYFWEYAPQQALWWAKRRQKRHNWNEPIAIVASMIRLGFCFDLLDPHNINYLDEIHQEYKTVNTAAGVPIPRNANHYKYLDCAIFQYAYAAIEASGEKVDSARAVYVPTDSTKRIWERSWISRDTHIQVCVRNQACILGTWLYHTKELEGSDGVKESEEASSIDIEFEDQESSQTIEGDADDGSSSIDGEGEADDSGRGR
ncbi:hypothetical protein Enr8_28420 [Blastopirellula retiformator]|uniref:Uncharacterized protein n=1 Tax=Blastopirellula retiformator TaxID=2527970 RepID=A0A5C5V5K3_9BACT|nr:hypothetical protein Enr8_28420 [Blastopirellula retiformator]